MTELQIILTVTQLSMSRIKWITNWNRMMIGLKQKGKVRHILTSLINVTKITSPRIQSMLN
jgi:hypothetical protein